MGRVARCCAAFLALIAARAAFAADPPGENVAPAPISNKPESTTPHIPAPMPEAEEAIDLSIVYTFDIWHNQTGGIRRGTRYLDNFDLTARIDAERALGWRGATLFAYGLYNNGVGMSRSLVGNFQDSSNIETEVRAARLYEAWIEQKFAGGKGSLKLGLYDLNSEFDE